MVKSHDCQVQDTMDLDWEVNKYPWVGESAWGPLNTGLEPKRSSLEGSSESLSGVLTPGCLTDSGGDKFCDGGKSGKRVVGNQASAFQNATGRSQEEKDMEEGAVVEVV
ncbi:hypothetical protein J6590_063402 [Homalodisca vitripennis]|nr:hypothetical protein J6590_063402 [Homalodisca vitripennis]